MVVAVVLVVAAGAAHLLGVVPVVVFFVAAAAAAAIAVLARLVGGATEQLGGRVGSSAAGVVQSALGTCRNCSSRCLPDEGLAGVVQAALVGSVLATACWCSGSLFSWAGFEMARTLPFTARADDRTSTMLGAATLSIPTLAHAFHTPAAPHGRALNFICAGVLIICFSSLCHPFWRR